MQELAAEGSVLTPFILRSVHNLIVRGETTRDEPVIATGSSKSRRLNDLLSRIGKSKRAIDFDAQYLVWATSFNSLLAEVKEASVLMSNAYREGWGGTVQFREFPIVDVETFRAIREGRPYSRTWFFHLKLDLPSRIEDLVFFFGRASYQSVEINRSLDGTASLGISRLMTHQGRYVNIHQQDWSRVKEITHDGVRMGVSLVEDRILRHAAGEDSTVAEWFAILMEDVTLNLGGYELGT